MRYAPLLLTLSCAPTEAQINAAIEQANHCELPEDCVDAGSVCPFGCDIYVHTDEVDRIRQLLDSWLESAETCTYRCQPSAGVVCDDFRCVPSYGQ